MGDRLFELRLALLNLFFLPRNLYRLGKLPRIRPGDAFIDCDNHPVICTESTLESRSNLAFGPWDYDLAGVSLLDGSYPHSCSAKHCAPRKVSYEFAVMWAATEPERRKSLENIYGIYKKSPELRNVWS